MAPQQLILTIDSDNDEPIKGGKRDATSYDSESDSGSEDGDERQKSADKKKKNFSSSFKFEGDGGMDFKQLQSFDFSIAKLGASKGRNANANATTLDEKIHKKRLAQIELGVLSSSNEDDLVEEGEASQAKEDYGDQDELMAEDDAEDDSPKKESKKSKGKDASASKVERDDMKEMRDIVKEKRAAEYFDQEAEGNLLGGDEEDNTFTSLALSRPILKAVAAMGFVKPTDIQARCIPLALQGRDICASAVTGSGKTAAFIIPILERLLFRPKSQPATRVLVLVPTRELGAQCHSVASSLSRFSEIDCCLCVGGLSNKIQEAELGKKPDVVIATPGRLIDHIHNSKSFSLDDIEILVIDEADRILEDGFKAELEEIIKHTPVKRQTLLFSATMTDNIDELIKLSLNRPIRLFVDSSTSLTTKLVQEFVRVRGHKEEARPAILAALCARTYTRECLVFFRSKAAAHHMKILFGLLGLKAAELHGNLTQLQRLESLESFRDKKVDFLLATDVASRGLDISGIKTVINYDMPGTYQVYVHRCGRTARGDASGRAVSLVGENDRAILKLALKNSRDAVKHRVVPAPVITKFETSIKGVEGAIKEIYEEEKEDKAIGVAEMEVRKAQNRLEHEDEILARPARTWFQTEHEKQKEKEVKLPDANAPKRIKTDGMSRRKKRLFQARTEDKEVNAKQSIAARSAKASLKPTKIKQFAGDISKKSSPGSSKGKGGKRGSSFDSEKTSANKRKKH